MSRCPLCAPPRPRNSGFSAATTWKRPAPKRINALIAAGKDYTVAVYHGAEHGMTECELNASGERVSTRFAPGYFQMMADFIRDGRSGEHYGKAAITRRKPFSASPVPSTGCQLSRVADSL